MSAYTRVTPPHEHKRFTIRSLGGAGEIGMNMSLYGYDGHWLMIDMGIGFGDETTPGIDVMTPDPAFILNQIDRLSGLVVTHAA